MEEGVVFTVSGSIQRSDIPALCERVRSCLAISRSRHLICDVGGVLDPDAAAVDALARLHLTARGLGCDVRLRHAGSELQELLDFMGLRDVLPLCQD